MSSHEPFVVKEESYLLLREWQEQEPHLVAGFSTRFGGVSEAPFASMNLAFHVDDQEQNVVQNRQLLAARLGFPVEQWVGTEQVHQAAIQKVDRKDAGKGALSFETALKATDGMYTKEEDLLLTSLYADCVPLYFWAPTAQLIGLAHAGWQGTIALIGPKMIRKWQDEERVSASDIHVAIGPCISQAAYEVDDRVIERIKQACDSTTAEACYRPNKHGRYQLDLRELNRRLLIQSGVRAAQISTTSLCTAKELSFYSHRQEKGKTGRMMSFIGRSKRKKGGN